MQRFLLFFLFSAFSVGSSAQTGKDTIVLLNGSVFYATVIDTTGGVTSIKSKKNPDKNIIIENDRIFSIIDSTGEHLMYAYDTTLGNEFTIPEMRYFILGEQDAEKGFKANGAFFGNLALGAAAGVTGYFLCPIPPFAFTAFSGLPKVKIKHSTVSNLEYLKQETYLMGYERVARKKRKIRSLIGGGIGLGVGLGTFFILKSTGNDPIK
jgi:hypothetical protein